MRALSRQAVSSSSLLAVLLLAWAAGFAVPAAAQEETLSCDSERSAPLLPTDPALCARLWPIVQEPDALPLNEYEEKLGDFLRNWCHRDMAGGWVHDKSVRDTGPYIATLTNGEWSGTYYGTHAPVVIWYSPDMLEWLRVNRPLDEHGRELPPPENPEPIPDGAVMVKEMYDAPAADCAKADLTRLLPPNGAAVMVRSPESSHDGWFWGWFGWSGWDPDWPAGPSARLPYMGFGQYCVNCHASSEDGLTFASLKNIAGEPGRPLVFLSQHFFDAPPPPDHHRLVALPQDDPGRLGQPLFGYDVDFVRSVPAATLPRPSWNTVDSMPPQTYDNVWVEATPDGVPTAASQYVTSDQCLGCHDAGGTGLQYDMTLPNPVPGSDNLLNLSQYGTWRTSPMGLGGRDPIFFAQLASEIDTFHPEGDLPEIIQDTCLGCHGVTGQRQFKIDAGRPDPYGGSAAAYVSAEAGENDCPPFLRSMVNAVPFPADRAINPAAAHSNYGALARDGISCTACHRMMVGVGDGPALETAENRCVKERQELLNPEATGFARTFTGSFLVGPPDELIGPFESPKTMPMEHALGSKPIYDAAMLSSEVCGSCHTVHLPVFDGEEIVARTYEQTTYPEWAFSAYRTGSTPQIPELPSGAGAKAKSCQECHMKSADRDGTPFRSKIAGIQEYSNFPQAEYALPPDDLDLDIREGFARHTLVGLNVFFVKMAQQFPDILGIRTQDPMMVGFGVDPALFTEQAMLEQASYDTAKVSVSGVTTSGGKLSATVTVESLTGHKMPSGVGFRRAFVELEVLDAAGNVLWASGRTDGAGVLVDQNGAPVAGEYWWKPDCSGLAYAPPGELPHQPHFQKITRQDQVQIYQELVTAPGPRSDGSPNPTCGKNAKPEGPFTTSFLSICGHVKDNRILPDGFLPLAERIAISEALGAGEDMAIDSGPVAVDGDPDYVSGGKDSLVYEVDLSELPRAAADVRAALYYQAIPPYFLQDRFCTSNSDDTQRLFFLAGHLDLSGTEAADWKLEIVGSGEVAVR